jgi:hypothetical protein
MKLRCNTTLISALLISLCLVISTPTSLELASTWKVVLYQCTLEQEHHFLEENRMMPVGLYSLGFEIIGLIVLWTGYRKKERWSWFVMVIILLFFVFPSIVLPQILPITQDPVPFKLVFPQYFYYGLYIEILKGNHLAIWIAIGQLTFPVMAAALLLPIKAFFWRQPAAQLKAESPHKRA